MTRRYRGARACTKFSDCSNLSGTWALPGQGARTDFPLWPEDQQAASRLLAGADLPLIGVHPSAMDLTRQWPAERFASAANQLQRRVGGTVVLLGGEPQRVDAEIE